MCKILKRFKNSTTSEAIRKQQKKNNIAHRVSFTRLNAETSVKRKLIDIEISYIKKKPSLAYENCTNIKKKSAILTV